MASMIQIDTNWYTRFPLRVVFCIELSIFCHMKSLEFRRLYFQILLPGFKSGEIVFHVNRVSFVQRSIHIKGASTFPIFFPLKNGLFHPYIVSAAMGGRPPDYLPSTSDTLDPFKKTIPIVSNFQRSEDKCRLLEKFDCLIDHYSFLFWLTFSPPH